MANNYQENINQFYKDLDKIKDQFDYDSKGHGSINIYDVEEDGKVVAMLNWSANGDQNTKWARAFAEALLEAIEACEKFNSTHKLNAI